MTMHDRPLSGKLARPRGHSRAARRAKTPIAFRVDPDVLEFFKRHGPGYQGRMNAGLLAFMQSQS